MQARMSELGQTKLISVINLPLISVIFPTFTLGMAPLSLMNISTSTQTLVNIINSDT